MNDYNKILTRVDVNPKNSVAMKLFCCKIKIKNNAVNITPVVSQKLLDYIQIRLASKFHITSHNS